MFNCPGLRLLLIRQRALLLENDAASFPVLPVAFVASQGTFNLADGTDNDLRLQLVLALAERLLIAHHGLLELCDAGRVLSYRHIDGADPLTKRSVGICKGLARLGEGGRQRRIGGLERRINSADLLGKRLVFCCPSQLLGRNPRFRILEVAAELRLDLRHPPRDGLISGDPCRLLAGDVCDKLGSSI